MRLELALIVGILFFCSWCAYIVARMNASVSPGAEQPAAPARAQANWTSSAAAAAGQQDYQPFGARARAPQVEQSRGAPTPSQARPFDGASESSLARLQAPWSPPAPPQQHQQHQHQRQQQVVQQPYAPASFYQQPQRPAAAAPQWQAYALPTSLTPAGAFGPAPELLGQEERGAELPVEAEAEEEEGAQRERPQAELQEYEDEEEPALAAASDYAAPTMQQSGDETEAPNELAGQPDDGGGLGGGGLGDGDDEDESDEMAEPGGRPASELDEVAQRRSFSELESSSKERDQDGNLLVTRRRHLINGKPVRKRPNRGGQLAAADANYAAESARDQRRASGAERVGPAEAGGAQEADFRQLVEELDQEDKLRKAAERRLVAGGPSRPSRRSGDSGARGPRSSGAGHLPAGSGVAARVRRRRVRLASRPRAGDDKHEHRLSETLTQQQWDDDAASSSSARPAGEVERRVSDIVEQDEEARRLEQMSRDLMLNPDFAELQRRKRSLEEGARETREVETPSPWGDDQGRPDYGGETGERAAAAAAAAPFDETDGAEDQAKLANTRADKGQAPPAEGDDDGDDNGDDEAGFEEAAPALPDEAGEELQSATVANNSSGAELGRLLRNAGDDAAQVQRQSVKAGAAAVDSARQTGGALIKSSIGAPLANAAQPAETVGAQEDMHVEILAQPPGSNHSLPVQQFAPQMVPVLQQQQQQPPAGLGHFPRVASPFASGSSKVAKKRKKARKFAKKRSKLVEAKFKAAKAYASKQRSKQKRGQMRKKKRKSEKKLVAGKRHFAGATRGHKQAHGRGARGARKGATYYKDKGYKKKGFKKAYHKLETGDHKTYFDEFRDKDHNKKWKNYDDKHKYSQKKKWAGHDLKHMRHHDLKEARGKASKSGKWSERARSEHTRKAKKYRSAKKKAVKSMAAEKAIKKKKKKKKHAAAA